MHNVALVLSKYALSVQFKDTYLFHRTLVSENQLDGRDAPHFSWLLII